MFAMCGVWCGVVWCVTHDTCYPAMSAMNGEPGKYLLIELRKL